MPLRACAEILNEQSVGSDDPLSISQLLDKIVREHPHESLAMSDLAELLHYRSWGGLLLIFASINMLPLPPGASMFTGLPILVISAQMALGSPAPWFPARLDRRGLKMDELKKLIEKLRPVELRIERIFRPRLLHLSGQQCGQGHRRDLLPAFADRHRPDPSGAHCTCGGRRALRNSRLSIATAS